MRRTIRSTLYTEKVGQVCILDPASVGDVLAATSYLDGTHLVEGWYTSLAGAILDPQDPEHEAELIGPPADKDAGSTRKRKASVDPGFKRGGADMVFGRARSTGRLWPWSAPWWQRLGPQGHLVMVRTK